MSFRSINLNSGESWEYQIGKENAVIVSPVHKNGKPFKTIVSLADITGRDSDSIDRGRRKKTSDGMITPKDICNYIAANREKLLGSK